MKRLHTKADREGVKAAFISQLKAAGFTESTHKDLTILQGERNGLFVLYIYKGTAANPFYHCSFRNEAARENELTRYKIGADNRVNYKAEMKEKRKGHLTGAAECAEAIRTELKQVWPGIKFSVRSETFSGGDAVRIGWADGPTVKEVDVIAEKYKDGHFDGMTDMYEYKKGRTGPGAKYITTCREMSEQTRISLRMDAEPLHAKDNFDCHDVSQYIYRIFVKTSLPAGAVVTGLVPTGNNSGSVCPSTFYKAAYTSPQQQGGPKPAHTQTEPVAQTPGKMQIVAYSEKAIAVTGDTYPHRVALKNAGGKFNARLSCGAGWIFSKKHTQDVEILLTTLAI